MLRFTHFGWHGRRRTFSYSKPKLYKNQLARHTDYSVSQTFTSKHYRILYVWVTERFGLAFVHFMLRVTNRPWSICKCHIEVTWGTCKGFLRHDPTPFPSMSIDTFTTCSEVCRVSGGTETSSAPITGAYFALLIIAINTNDCHRLIRLTRLKLL